MSAWPSSLLWIQAPTFFIHFWVINTQNYTNQQKPTYIKASTSSKATWFQLTSAVSIRYLNGFCNAKSTFHNSPQMLMNIHHPGLRDKIVFWILWWQGARVLQWCYNRFIVDTLKKMRQTNQTTNNNPNPVTPIQNKNLDRY